LRLKDEDKDKESSFKDKVKDTDLMSKDEDKDEDLNIGPRGSSRIRTFLEDSNTANLHLTCFYIFARFRNKVDIMVQYSTTTARS